MSIIVQMMRGLRVEKDGQHVDNRGMEFLIPSEFLCPISLDLMKDPVTLSSGFTYDREYIEKWFQAGNGTCPVTNQVLENFELIPNHAVRKMIQDWCVQNRDNGLERIPTPKVPITPTEISKILARIQALSHCFEREKCIDSIQKIEKWCFESEQNRLCIIDHGATTVLVVAFDEFAHNSIEYNSMVLEEILSSLTWIFPLGEEDKKILCSEASLRCMVWLLSSRDEAVKKNAIFTMQEMSSDKKVIEALEDMQDVHKVLFKLISDQACPAITRASLQVTKNLLSLSASNEKLGSKFVEMGLIPTLLDIIIDSGRNLCEKALGVFYELCDLQKGMQEAYKNDLTMPVLVSKFLRSSAVATDYSVSVVWKLLENEKESGEVKAAIEVLQLGAFQKLVLLLQVDYARKTKEKATKLLKLLNPLRPGKDCIDPIDFNNLKRSF